jgi:hypothetical protein
LVLDPPIQEKARSRGGDLPGAAFSLFFLCRLPVYAPAKIGSPKLDTYPFVTFATFCSSPLFSFWEKPGLAFRDHHWLAKTRKLCVRFPLLASVQILFSPSVKNQDWPSGITTARTNSQIMRSFPLLPSVQLLFSPSVRNQDPGLHADY